MKAVAAQQRCATLQAVVAGRQRRVAPTSGRASDGWQWTHAASGEGGVDARRARGGRERRKADALIPSENEFSKYLVNAEFDSWPKK